MIGIRRTRTWGILACLFLIPFLRPVATACTYLLEPINVRSSFSVQVLNLDKPVSGLRIELQTDPRDGESRTLLTLYTNESGSVEFVGLKPGRYYVQINHIAFSDTKEVAVENKQAKNATSKIKFDWPTTKPLSVRSVSGLLNAQIRTNSPLNDQAHPVFAVLGGAKITLLQAASGDLVDSEIASESGAFDFHTVPAGLYMLHIELPENAKDRYYRQDGYVPVDVDPSAKASTLDLYLFPGTCVSLGYKNRQESATE